MSTMYLPCEVVARYILPVFRSMIAKDLIEKYELTQVEAAKRLGTTQAAISQYIHSKRGYGSLSQFENAMPKIQKCAQKTAKRIAKENVASDEVMKEFCELCKELRKTG
jgi:predicted transcriptional regulator